MLPGKCIGQCEFDRNPTQCVCGTTLMAELCDPKDMCSGEDIKCSNLGEEPRRECRVAGRKKYLQGVDRAEWPTGDCHEWLARDATEDGVCAPARQCYTRCTFAARSTRRTLSPNTLQQQH